MSVNHFPLLYSLKSSILFLVFNRPDTTRLVFEAIRQAKPPRLYIAADGAREDKDGEIDKVHEVRALVTNIDWDCEVKTLFRDENLGCKMAISSAIDWFFEHEEMGIILEDDCLPHPTFFRFCDELLEKYRNDTRIAMISGNNFQFGKRRTENSYYFSRYPHIWGWASWRRTWKHYDVNMKVWPEVRNGGWLKDVLNTKKSIRYWNWIFEKMYKGNVINTWDYQFTFLCFIQNALTILPNINLVSNIGFGSDATHTKEKNKFMEMITEEMTFPLSHPIFVVRDSIADSNTEQNMFSFQPFILRAFNKLIRIVRSYAKI